MSSDFMPYGRQCIDEDDIEAVAEALRGDWLTTGPAVVAFEQAFAEAVDAPFAIACSNGTTALHLALAGLGIGPGDVCVVPSITFLATANAVRYCGADVVFADVDPDTGLMNAEHLQAAIACAGAEAVKAVLPVHLAGQCADLAALRSVCDQAQADMVEDACHAVGSAADDNLIGACAHSHAACFSFHPVKTIAAGEGGMVTTGDTDLAERMRRLRSHGVVRDGECLEKPDIGPWWHEMPELGWNYRLSDILAALGRSQLSKLTAFKKRRTELAAIYDQALSGASPYLRPMARAADNDPCLHLYASRIDFDGAGIGRAKVMTRLRENGIGSQVHYIPVPAQPYYRNRYSCQVPPGARTYYERTLSLPLYVGMSDADPIRVVEVLESILNSH